MLGKLRGSNAARTLTIASAEVLGRIVLRDRDRVLRAVDVLEIDKNSLLHDYAVLAR